MCCLRVRGLLPKKTTDVGTSRTAELENATFGKRAEYAVYVSCVELGMYLEEQCM